MYSEYSAHLENRRAADFAERMLLIAAFSVVVLLPVLLIGAYMAHEFAQSGGLLAALLPSGPH